MTAQSARLTERSPEALPDGLETAPAKLVYLTLSSTNAQTADDLCTLLDVDKLTLLAVLSSMADRGLVERNGEQYAPR